VRKRVVEGDGDRRAADDLRRLLKSCHRRDSTNRRDTAIIRLFIDTGIRMSEAAGCSPTTSTWTTRS
jgi:site-specific recombinase XerC